MLDHRNLVSRLFVGAAMLLSTATAFGQSFETPVGRTHDAFPSLFGHGSPLASFTGTEEVSETGLQTVGFECCDDPCVTAYGCDALSAGSEDRTWVLVAPYLWTPAMKGTIGANGNTQSIDISVKEVFEDLLPQLDGAFMAHVEVGKGHTGLILDGMILQVSETNRGPLGEAISVESNLTILEAMGMYRVMGSAPGDPCPMPVKFDLLGGARYYQVQGGVNIVPPLGATVSSQQSESWVDLVIGARGGVTITQGLDAFVRADVGGFGIGTSSNPAWGLDAGIDYKLACCPGSSLVLGYKVLDINESKKSGAEQFVFDVRIHGPFMALAFRF